MQKPLKQGDKVYATAYINNPKAIIILVKSTTYMVNWLDMDPEYHLEYDITEFHAIFEPIKLCQ